MQRATAMMRQGSFSTDVLNRRLIEGALLLGAIMTGLSGAYFLLLPSGSYQEGLSPMQEMTVLFGQHTWHALHVWGGLLTIGAGIIYLVLHWQWVEMMRRHVMCSLLVQRCPLSERAQGNSILDGVTVLSFLLVALSGIYLLLAPSGGFQAGWSIIRDSSLLSRQATLDVIHTWAGLVLVGTTMLHC